MDFKFDPGPVMVEQYEPYIVNFGDTTVCHKNITHTYATTNNSELDKNNVDIDNEIASNYYTTVDGHSIVFKTEFNLQTANENASISNSDNHTYKNVKSEPADMNSETYISNDIIPDINAEIEPGQHVYFGYTDEIKSDHADKNKSDHAIFNVKRKHTDDFAMERVEHTETLVKGEMDIGPVELLPTDFALTMRQLKEEPAINHRNNAPANISNGSPSSQDHPPLRELKTTIGDLKLNKHKKPSKKKKMSFKCRLCPTKLTSLAHFNSHTKTHILEYATEKQECIECHIIIESVIELKSHYNNVHPEIIFTIFICDVCSKSFALKQSLALHCRSKHANGKQKEKEIQASKLSRKKRNHTDIEPVIELKSHYNNVDPEKKLIIFICDVCSKSFPLRQSLAIHFRSQHANGQKKQKHVQASNEKYACGSCPAQFTCKANRVRHYKMYHTEARFIQYTCDVCGRTYKRKGSLRDHIINKHFTPKSFHIQIYQPCPHCSKMFANSGYLKRHMDRVHLGRKNKKCNDCGKKFISQTNFAKHVLMCENELQINKERLMSLNACTIKMIGNWVCEICKKSYKNRQSKMDHIRRYHINTKKLCNVCGLSLSCQYALTKHLLRKHSGPRRRKLRRQIQETLTPTTFKCDICLHMYATKRTLRAHFTRYHPIGSNLDCDLCHKTFKCKSSLSDHLRTVHKDLLPYSCDRCSMTFYIKDKVTSHVKRCFKV